MFPSWELCAPVSRLKRLLKTQASQEPNGTNLPRPDQWLAPLSLRLNSPSRGFREIFRGITDEQVEQIYELAEIRAKNVRVAQCSPKPVAGFDSRAQPPRSLRATATLF